MKNKSWILIILVSLEPQKYPTAINQLLTRVQHRGPILYLIQLHQSMTKYKRMTRPASILTNCLAIEAAKPLVSTTTGKPTQKLTLRMRAMITCISRIPMVNQEFEAMLALVITLVGAEADNWAQTKASMLTPFTLSVSRMKKKKMEAIWKTWTARTMALVIQAQRVVLEEVILLERLAFHLLGASNGEWKLSKLKLITRLKDLKMRRVQQSFKTKTLNHKIQLFRQLWSENTVKRVLLLIRWRRSLVRRTDLLSRILSWKLNK